MNKTQDQNKEVNNDTFLKRIQQIVSENEIPSILSNIKKSLLQAESVDKTIQERMFSVKAEQIAKKEEESKKVVVEIIPEVKVEIETPVVDNSETKQEQKPVQNNNYQNTRTRNFEQTSNYQNRQFSDRPQYQQGQRPPYQQGDRPQYQQGQRPPYQQGQRPPYQQGDRPQYQQGQRPPYQQGQRPPYQQGQRPPYQQGDRPQYQQGQRPPYQQGQRPPYQSGNNNGTGFVKRNDFSKPNATIAPAIEKSDKKFEVKKKTPDRSYDEKKGMNKRALIMRGFVADESLSDEDIRFGGRRSKSRKKEEQVIIAPKIEHAVITSENLTVKLLAEKIGKPVSDIMKKFLLLGMMVNINSTIDFASAELIASELGVTIEQKIEKSYEEKLTDMATEVDDEKDLKKRPPVVTVLGHVDHGKTSLLDYIRNTNVISGEAGGITQHIGAYTIEVKKEMITFIDTPGHAAFTSMRERGAKLTDIAILVVAADDGVMPQTVEAIKQIRQVNVPMIVAINKIDKPNINIDRVKQQLADNEVVPEEWGGDAILVPIAAKTGQNIEKLLEMILFVAEYQTLRANPKRKAVGSIIEAKLDKGQGPVATVLVQNGTLRVGDSVIAGTTAGKIRNMFNDRGQSVKSAGPSFAVSVLGLAQVPSAGDEIYVVDEKLSKKVLSERIVKEKTDKIKDMDISVDSLMNRFKAVEYKYLNVLIKGDVQGTVEALTQTLSEIENDEVKVKCIHGGVGAVNENDVMLAQASNAIIVVFNSKLDFKAKVLVDKYKVKTFSSKIIYEVAEHITKIIDTMVTPKYKEVVTGHAEVRMIFKASKVGSIAGSYILDGKLTRNQNVKVLRKGKEVFAGTIGTIQREKNEVKEILSGFECGIVINNFSAFEEGDVIEAYILERIN